MVLPRFGFRAIPVATTENDIANERRYRAEVERAFRDGDVALVQIQKAIDAMVVWGGPWLAGRTYRKNTMVLDSGWLMVAKAETTDRAAPLPIGSPRWLLDDFGDPPPWVDRTAVAATRVLAGARAQIPSNNSIIAYRVWAEAGNVYRVVFIEDVGAPGGGTVTLSDEVEAQVDGWVEVELTPKFVTIGRTYDLFLLTRDPSVPSIDLTANWDYNRVNNATPTAGNINHANTGVMHINAVDGSAVNRSAYLANIGPGDQITAQGILWAVAAASQAGAVFTFVVTPTTRITNNGTYSFLFKDFQPAAIEYVEIVNGWVPYPTIQGLFSITDYANAIVNENVYGIDVLIQPMDLSPDWEIMSYAENL